MIIDTHLHPTNLVDEAWRHTGTPFTGERMLKMMDGPYMINGKPRRIDMGFIQPPPGITLRGQPLRPDHREQDRAGPHCCLDRRGEIVPWPDRVHVLEYHALTELPRQLVSQPTRGPAGIRPPVADENPGPPSIRRRHLRPAPPH